MGEGEGVGGGCFVVIIEIRVLGTSLDIGRYLAIILYVFFYLDGDIGIFHGI